MPDLTNLPDLGSSIVDVAIRSAIIYVFLVVAIRLGGKREVGQLTTPDLVVLLVVANAVQNAMVGSNNSLIGGIVSTAVVLGIARLIQILGQRSPWVEEVLIGKPRILVVDGVPDAAAMRDEEIGSDELSAALREHGMVDLGEVHLAVLEVDGSISVIPVEHGDGGADDGAAATGARAGSGGTTGHRRAGRIPRPGGVRVGRRGRSTG